jgi:hypothetical protein
MGITAQQGQAKTHYAPTGDQLISRRIISGSMALANKKVAPISRNTTQISMNSETEPNPPSFELEL